MDIMQQASVEARMTPEERAERERVEKLKEKWSGTRRDILNSRKATGDNK